MGWSNLREEIEDIFSILEVPEVGSYTGLHSDVIVQFASVSHKVCRRCGKTFSMNGRRKHTKHCQSCQDTGHPERNKTARPTKCVVCKTKLLDRKKEGPVRFVCGRKCQYIRASRKNK